MKIGIMQPYFVPYIGYWQLMNAVDKYVVYDDVNFIKGGWINRNRILVNGQPKYFNIQMIGASPNKFINEVEVNIDNVLSAKNMRILEGAYKKAPYYSEVLSLIEDIIYCKENNIVDFIMNSFRVVNEYLDIDTELIMSSTLNKNCELRAQDKVIDICKKLCATEYYNPVGGQDLYSYDDFTYNGIKLKFVSTDTIIYKQYENEFVSNLSILDVLAFNKREDVIKMLNKYTIIER